MKKYKYPKQKHAREFTLQQYKNVKISLYVPNVLSYKTIQFELTGWIHIDDADQNQIDRSFYLVRRKIKEQIKNYNNDYFKKESIVVITTAVKSTAKQNYQFLKIATTHFVQPMLIYNQQYILKLMEPFYQNVIDDIMKNETFTIITKNKKI